MKCSLFIIDDDDIFHRILEIMVQKSQTFEKVTHFTHPRAVLDYLMAHRSDPAMLPDVLFVDLNMPEMSGWEVLDELQQIYSSLPKPILIYIVTTAISSFEVARTEKYRFVKEFISKPLSFNKLLSIYDQALINLVKFTQAEGRNLKVHSVTEGK